MINALSHAWLDGSALRTYRHAPNTGSRKSWAAGDAASRAVRLALIALTGEMGYPSALTAKTWGFQDVLFRGQPVKLARPLGSYVMENVLFKISFPRSSTPRPRSSARCRLHPMVAATARPDRRVEIDDPRVGDPDHRQDRTAGQPRRPGPLPAVHDRGRADLGRSDAEDYEDRAAADPRIDALRAKMRVAEDRRYSADYLDPDRRSIANAVEVFFDDGTSTGRVEVEYPIGHRRRRKEGIPLLVRKAEAAFAAHFGAGRARGLLELFADRARLEAMPVAEFSGLLTSPASAGPG